MDAACGFKSLAHNMAAMPPWGRVPIRCFNVHHNGIEGFFLKPCVGEVNCDNPTGAVMCIDLDAVNMFPFSIALGRIPVGEPCQIVDCGISHEAELTHNGVSFNVRFPPILLKKSASGRSRHLRTLKASVA